VGQEGWFQAVELVFSKTLATIAFDGALPAHYKLSLQI
jgi:hypothetical protein